MNITIIGAGHVGLATGACLAWLDNHVSFLDVDEKKIAALRAGHATIYEPGLASLLELVQPRLHFTTACQDALIDAEIVFIAVGTPAQADGSPDLSHVKSAATLIAEHAGRESILVVNKSTIPVGGVRWIEALLRAFHQPSGAAKPRRRFSVASNPEFLREGTALCDSFHPDRIVIGAEDPQSLDLLENLYRPIASQSFEPPPFLPRSIRIGEVPIVKTTSVSAELIKYASNAFLAMKISFINEVGRLAERIGADIVQVAEGVGEDSRIGREFLRPGIGWGGSCFGKDTAALVSIASEYGVSLPIIEGARAINQEQRKTAVEQLQRELRVLRGREIGILGLAFKPDTSDLRDAPALEIARLLRQRGAIIRAHDPVALPWARLNRDAADIDLCDDVRLVFRGADAVVLTTEWPQYLVLPWESLLSEMRTPLVFDGRRFLDRSRLAGAGFRYTSFAL